MSELSELRRLMHNLEKFDSIGALSSELEHYSAEVSAENIGSLEELNDAMEDELYYIKQSAEENN